MIKKIIILLFMCLFLTSCNKTPLEKALNDIKENNPKTITLSDYTNFKWDEVWLISGSISGLYITLMREQNIDVKKVEMADDNPDFGRTQEFSNTVVYIYNNRVVYYEFPPDARDYVGLASEGALALLDFKLERGQIIVVSSNNSECEVKGKTLIPIKPIKIYENMDKKLK